MSKLEASKAGLDVGIVALDFEPMRAFYVDVLGLEYVEQLTIPWGTMHRLRFGASWLKLVEPTTRPEPIVHRGIDAATGIRYITFEIANIEEVWARAIAADTEVFHDLGPFGKSGVTMGMLYDPDGNVVELLRRP
jgi:catechol 2,3-dioxygenase-like lactoylglutathione lyase family enzyme